MKHAPILLLASAIIFAGCSISTKPPRTPVVIQHPRQPTTIKASGQVFSRQEADVYPRRDGIVLSLAVDVGDHVEEGQRIATLQGDASQQQLAAELAFKREELKIAREREAEQESRAELTAELARKAVENERAVTLREREARIQQITVQIAGKEREREQNMNLAENTVFDLVEAIADMLFTRSDALATYDRNSSYDYHRRRELYYPNDAAAVAFEGKLLSFYRSLEREVAETIGFARIAEAVALGEEARVLANNFSPSSALPIELINAMRKRAGDVLDQLLRHAANAKRNESEIAVLEAETEQVRALSQRTIQEPLKENVSALRTSDTIVAEIERIKSQMGGGNIVYAPFSGLITKRHVDIGDSVHLGKPLYALVDDSQKYIRFFVAQEIFPLIHEDMAVGFSPTSAPEEKHAAIVTRIAPSIDPETGMIQVEAEIPIKEESRRILSGMSVIVHLLPAEDLPLLEIPKRSLEVSDRPNTVWVIRRGRATPRTVTVKFRQGEYAYVSHGISTEEAIVVESPIPLEPSMEVTENTQ